MSMIYEVLLKIEGLKYAITLNLNTGYYPTHIGEITSNLCTNICPLEKHH